MYILYVLYVWDFKEALLFTMSVSEHYELFIVWDLPGAHNLLKFYQMGKNDLKLLMTIEGYGITYQTKLKLVLNDANGLVIQKRLCLVHYISGISTKVLV